MNLRTLVLTGEAVLALHVAIIAFNLFGLVAVPVGAKPGWRFIRVRWWRALHLLSWGAVALQALFGRACFLTLWQNAAEGAAGRPVSEKPLIQRAVEFVIYWPLPTWLFSLLYLAAFVYVLWLWRAVPPERPPGHRL